MAEQEDKKLAKVGLKKETVEGTPVKKETVNIQVVSPNIYQRIQAVRTDLTKKNLKKTGENKFAHYTYYELGDFLPALNELMSEHGIMTRFLLKKDQAVLIIINTDTPDDHIVFYMPVASSEVKGATAIQQLGSQVTYLRRYLLMTAFEIAESDSENATQQKPDNVKDIDQIQIDKINKTKTTEELVKVCAAIQEEAGNDYRDSVVEHYKRRKKEIEEAKADDIGKGFDESQKEKGK